MRKVSLCARDKHEGCDTVGEVACVGCGVRARGGLCEAILFFPHFEQHTLCSPGVKYLPRYLISFPIFWGE